MNDTRMVVIYDGDCPFCRSYVKLMALRRRVGTVDLVDARSDDPRVTSAERDGYDLDEGMLAIYGGKTYYGGDAVALISALSSTDGGIQALLSKLLGNPTRARLLYPIMKFGRNLALRALGRSKIRSAHR
jgi:predicted DCC family thiol-disulfide oxidoreductase YuxK